MIDGFCLADLYSAGYRSNGDSNSAIIMIMRDKISFLLIVLASLLVLWFSVPLLYALFRPIMQPELLAQLFADSRFRGALVISISTAVLSALLAVPFAIAIAYVLAFLRPRGAILIETALVDVPQTFPPVAEGLIYLVLLGSDAPINLIGTFAAVLIAKFFVASPFAIGFVTRKFRDLERSDIPIIARSLGAGTGTLLWRVLIPLSLRDILGGFSLTFARAMGEFGGTLIFAGVIAWKTEIIPTYVSRVSAETPLLALAATAVLVVFSTLSILTFKSLAKRV